MVYYSPTLHLFLCWAYRTYSNRMISSIVELSVLPQYPRDVWRDFYRHIKEINILEVLYSHDVKQSALLCFIVKQNKTKLLNRFHCEWVRRLHILFCLLICSCVYVFIFMRQCISLLIESLRLLISRIVNSYYLSLNVKFRYVLQF